MAIPHTEISITSTLGRYAWQMPTSAWHAWNALMEFPTHPVPQLMLIDEATLDAKEAMALADRTLALTAIVYYGAYTIPLHLKMQYTYYHVDWWAPIAQSITTLRPHSMTIRHIPS